MSITGICVFLQVIWKKLYKKSARDHGTLGYFRSLLNRTTVTAEVKKAVDANLDFLTTVVKGHLLARACRILGITQLDDRLQLPRGILRASVQRQWEFVKTLARQVVEDCTVMDVSNDVTDTEDKVYNYARLVCHYGVLVLEFKDAWAEGDGERVFRYWRLMLPHFKASGRNKYSLEALRLQLQVKAHLSPQLAHQVKWDRFVNTRGGEGNNIPNDLYNEHVVKLVKNIIRCMGPNLTERALQRAARSISSLHSICKQYDKESGVPVVTIAHFARSDVVDVGRVTTSVLTNNLLQMIPGRQHTAFKNIRLNPLWNLDKKKTIEWIDRKKKEFEKFMGTCLEDGSDEEDADEYSDDGGEYVEECIAEYTEDEELDTLILC